MNRGIDFALSMFNYTPSTVATIKEKLFLCATSGEKNRIKVLSMHLLMRKKPHVSGSTASISGIAID
jgi:hypothetical protein